MVGYAWEHICVYRVLRSGIVEHGKSFGPSLSHDALFHFMEKWFGYSSVWIVTVLYARSEDLLVRETKARERPHTIELRDRP